MPPTSKQTLCFQDVLRNTSNDEEDGIANCFFELANARKITYQISKAHEITIKQDVSACLNHTGGIVWETSYLLLNYLRATSHSCERLLELGAGCGLVGLGVHRTGNISKQVYVTETHDVMSNLFKNWRRNYSKVERSDPSLCVCELDWNNHRQHCKEAQISKHSIDTIIGTDVVFATQLVEPLLKTMRFLAHENTVAYLCLQERCKDSHQLLIDKAKDYDFNIKDISTRFNSLPSCQWGKDLDCCLLKFTVVVKDRKNKRKRHRVEKCEIAFK
jgi:hypothetical protein